MKKNAQAGFGLVLALVLGMAISGTPGIVSPIDSIDPTCKDLANNDGDQAGVHPLIVDIKDFQDRECLWMPFKFGFGEYDGLGAVDPSAADVSSYVSIWNNIDNYPTYYEAVKAGGAAQGLASGSAECSSIVQTAMIEYRDTYGLPDSKTGSSTHQAECGVSY